MATPAHIDPPNAAALKIKPSTTAADPEMQRMNILAIAEAAIALDDASALSWLLDAYLDYADPYELMKLLKVAVKNAIPEALAAMDARALDERKYLETYVQERRQSRRSS